MPGRPTGRSRPRPGIGQHFVIGNTSNLRYEGNRFYFQTLEVNENLKKLLRIRRELEAMPGAIPMKEWTKNQQLAYWLNLYNITLVEALGRAYPEQQIRTLLYGPDGHHGLLDKKLLKVAGVRLSLNDIQYRILMPGWRDPLVMYGLFKGYVGSPNITKVAFTAHTVWDMLKQNAVEFINSNRGARMDGTLLRVSEFYGENRALFPAWPDDLKAHLAKYADTYYASRFRNADAVKATTHDYYIADLMQGIRNDSNPNAGNPAALIGSLKSINAQQMEDWLIQKNGHLAGVRVPNLVMHYLIKIQKRKAARKGHVDVEEVEDNSGGKGGQ
ncbi:DUF547 domain-containing protein [Kordiimonas marina]|uniref:DUF547 domain-containing protein n=1 Tax=Kordiimonas marina TaxID=2872312 RepID=UPI001FF594EC|nr:DUF547 domain-containing protein [Kordiimonas marina]MCJ9430632.1 DUF547 domain-containing protein [Kordiimonas marina]